MKIGYGKLGRSFSLRYEEASSVGGDIEVIRLLRYLREHHEIHLIGPNRADAEWENVINHYAPDGVLSNIPTVADHERYPDDPGYLRFLEALRSGVARLPQLDAYIIWLGQHGTASSFIPSVMEDTKDDPRLPPGITRPLMSLINYVYPIVYLLNERNIRPIWLCPDPRNKLKARDIANPEQRPVIAQYNDRRDNLFYNPVTKETKPAPVIYTYGGIEMLAVDRPEATRGLFDASRRLVPVHAFGLLANEGYPQINNSRLTLALEWLSGLPDGWELYGSWTTDSQRKLGRRVTTVPVLHVEKTLRRWRSTITFPATNTGWATAKPWECFAAGTVCFRHPKYDNQNHIYGLQMPKDLREFLSPVAPEQLHDRVKLLFKDDDLWRNITLEQRRYFERRYEELEGGATYINSALRLLTVGAL